MTMGGKGGVPEPGTYIYIYNIHMCIFIYSTYANKCICTVVANMYIHNRKISIHDR